jgi:hypothetical protein
MTASFLRLEPRTARSQTADRRSRRASTGVVPGGESASAPSVVVQSCARAVSLPIGERGKRRGVGPVTLVRNPDHSPLALRVQPSKAPDALPAPSASKLTPPTPRKSHEILSEAGSRRVARVVVPEARSPADRRADPNEDPVVERLDAHARKRREKRSPQTVTRQRRFDMTGGGDRAAPTVYLARPRPEYLVPGDAVEYAGVLPDVDANAALRIRISLIGVRTFWEFPMVWTTNAQWASSCASLPLAPGTSASTASRSSFV